LGTSPLAPGIIIACAALLGCAAGVAVEHAVNFPIPRSLLMAGSAIIGSLTVIALDRGRVAMALRVKPTSIEHAFTPVATDQSLDSLPGLAWSALASGAFWQAGKRFLAYTGYSNSDLMERWDSCVHPDDIGAYRAACAKSNVLDEGCTLELRLRATDGAYRRFLAGAQSTRDPGTGSHRLCFVAHEMAERNTREVRLTLEERGLRTIVDTIPGSVWRVGLEGLQFLNRYTTEYTGKTAVELAGDAWKEVIHPDDLEQFTAKWMAVVRSGADLQIEFRMRRHDDRYRWFRTLGSPLRDDNGNITGWVGIDLDIDDEKTIARALEASERSLSQLLESIPGMVMAFRSDGRIDYANRRVTDFLGLPLPRIREHGWIWNLHPGDIERVQKEWNACLATGRDMESTYRLRHFDGGYRWFDCRVHAVLDAQGRRFQWYGLLTDIDERLRAEVALREPQRSFRAMLDAIPGMVFVASADGAIEYMNQRLLQFIGISLESVLNDSWSRIIHPEDRNRFVASWSAHAKSGNSMKGEYRAAQNDGSWRWVHAMAEPFRDDDGKILRWYGSVVDIDDRHRFENALRNSEHSLRKITETIPALVWRSTPAMHLDYISDRLVQYTGKTLQQFALTGWTDVVHPDDLKSALPAILHGFDTGSPYAVNYRMRDAEGTYRWFEVRANPLRDLDGVIEHWYGLHIDIDERKRLEDALRQSEAKLTRAMQVAAVGELSASIAHEINQPLAAIAANANACERWLGTDPPRVDRARLSIKSIIQDTSHAAQVVERTRALFKAAKPLKTPMNIYDVIREVTSLMARTFSKQNITVTLSLAENLPLVPADKIQIQQVMVNLVQNACDSMAQTMARHRCLAIASHRIDQELVVEVRDNGEGLGDTGKVFESFFTTKSDGMGMGLAISRTIVEAHGGKITATHNAPMGATFTFTLPLDNTDDGCARAVNGGSPALGMGHKEVPPDA